MKFHFSKKTITRKKNDIRPFIALSRIEEIDLFGIFEDDEPVKIRLLQRISQKLKNFILKIKKNRQARKIKPPVRPSLLIGATCGVFAVTVVFGLITIFLLFGSYGGKYSLVTIPDLISLDAQSVITTDTDKFDYVLQYKTNPEKPIGSVILQSPSPGVKRKLFRKKNKITVTLTVNREKDLISLPKIVGNSSRDIFLLLKNAGLNVTVLEEWSSDYPDGTVTYCSRNEGESVGTGDQILIKVSKGKKILYGTVPNICGLSEANAIQKLEECGFSVGNVEYKGSDSPVGCVISQEYSKGTSLKEGTKISFSVSVGPGY